MECLFCKIAAKQIPATIIYEDDHIIAFNDIDAQAPYHVLIIPRQHIASLNELSPDHNALAGQLLLTAQKIAKQAGFAEQGYRTVINCNQDGGQTVFHLHLHVLAGRPLAWPPG